MFESTFSFALGEDIAALREAVRDFAQAPLRMSAATPVPGTPAMVRRSAAA